MNNSNGFSLLGTVVAGAVTSVLLLAMGQSSLQGVKTFKSIQTKNRMEALYQQVQILLANRTNCTEYSGLKNQNFIPNRPDETRDFTVALPGGRGDSLVSPRAVNPDWTVVRTFVDQVSPLMDCRAGRLNCTYLASLGYELEANASIGPLRSTFRRPIKLTTAAAASADEARPILNCEGVDSGNPGPPIDPGTLGGDKTQYLGRLIKPAIFMKPSRPDTEIPMPYWVEVRNIGSPRIDINIEKPSADLNTYSGIPNWATQYKGNWLHLKISDELPANADQVFVKVRCSQGAVFLGNGSTPSTPNQDSPNSYGALYDASRTVSSSVPEVIEACNAYRNNLIDERLVWVRVARNSNGQRVIATNIQDCDRWDGSCGALEFGLEILGYKSN